MNQRNWSWEAKQLLPHLAGMLGGGVTVQAGGGGLVAHALNSTTWHTGTLAEAQAPWAVTQTTYDAHVANLNAHHSRDHVLADANGLGGTHSVTGLTSGHVLRASGATAAAFAQLQHADLGGVTADQHHAQMHLLASNLSLGPDHQISGATVGHVLRATSGTSAVFAQLQHTDLGSVLPDQHHNQLHEIADSAHHSVLGAKYRVLGAVADNTLGLLTPLHDVSAEVSGGSLLRSEAGALGLRKVFSTVALDFDSDLNQVRLLAGNVLRSDHYASQLTGWGIDYRGAADFRYVYTDELHAKAFITDLEQALAGGQIVSKSVAVLAADFVLPAAGSAATLRVADLPSAPSMAVFVSGDLIRLRKFARAAGSLTIADAWGVVTAYTDGAGSNEGTQTWTFTRSAGALAGTATGTVAKDALVLDYGVSENGYYEVNAIDGVYALNSPYAQTVTWKGHPLSAAAGEGLRVRTRMGNLRGLFSVANEYGLYAGSGVTDADTYIRLSSNTNRINNLPMEWWSGGSRLVRIDSTDGVALQTSSTFDVRRSVTWLSGTTQIADIGAYAQAGVGRDTRIATYGNTTSDVTRVTLTATNLLSKWPLAYIMAERNAGGGQPEQITLAVGDLGGGLSGIALGGNVYTGYPVSFTGTLNVTGAATFANLNVTASGTFDDLTTTGITTLGGAVNVTNGMRWQNQFVVLDYVSAVYRGLSFRALTGATWAYGLTYRNQANTMLGAWGAYGTADALSYLYAGVTYNDTALRIYPASDRVGIGPNVVPAYTLDVAGALRATGAAIVEGVLTIGDALSSDSTTVALKRSNHTIATLLDTPTGDSFLRFGYQRTAGGNSYIDFYADPAANTTISGRWIRWAGVNGAMDLYNRGTGLMTFAQLGAADMRFQTNSLTRLTIESTGEVTAAGALTAGGQITAPNFDATTAYERDGVRGGIFVPLPSGGYLVDTGGTTWNGGTARAAGTYTFDLQAAANGSIPADALAILCSMMGKWSAANDAYYTILAPAGGTFSMVVRAQAGNVTFDQTGIVLLGTNGDITATVAGAVSNTWPLIRIHGYFI